MGGLINVADALLTVARQTDRETETRATLKTVTLLSIETVESNLRPCLFLCSLSNLFFIIKNSKSNIMRRIM